VGSELPSVNTLVGPEAHSTDAAILDGLPAERPVVLGAGGAALAFTHALPHARVFSRRGNWPPDVADADLVVNATPVRDQVLAELTSGQTLVDLPYPRPATADAAAAARPPPPAGLRALAAAADRDGRGGGARRVAARAHARHAARARRPQPRPQELDVGDEPLATRGRGAGQGDEGGDAAAARPRRPGRRA